MQYWSTQRDGADTLVLWKDTPRARVHGMPGAEDTLTELEEGVYQWTRRVPEATNTLSMEATALFHCEYAMLPAVSYNGNGWGADGEYTGFSYQGVPYKMAWHRTSVPGATYSGGEGFSMALFCAQEGGCSLYLLEDGAFRRHGLSWPEEESPRYLVGGRKADAWRDAITLPGTPRTVFTAYIVLDQSIEAKTGWHKLLDTAWRMNFHKIPCWFDLPTIREQAITYTKALYTKEADREAFSIGFNWRDGQWVKRDAVKYEIGWCGQNASLANSLFAYAMDTGDAEAKAMAFGVLDSWMAHNMLEGGLFRVMLDDLPEERLAKEMQDACNLGTASIQFWEAYDWAKKLGEDRPLYAKAAQGIANFACYVQREDGCLGKAWYRDGTLAVAEGTVGAFLVPALIETYRRTNEDKYKTAALAAHQYYMQELQGNGYTTAGALDTYCIDKESSMPLLRSSLDLYDMTGDTHYLACAEDAAWYLSTWQWHGTTQYPAGTALAEMGYDTFGGTAVSTSHLHIDPYALYYIPELLRLAEATQNPMWQERAAAIWQNATQGVSDGELVVMGKKRPVGSQDEGFLHTRFWDGFNVSQWLVAWPCAFRLEVLRRLGEKAKVLE